MPDLAQMHRTLSQNKRSKLSASDPNWKLDEIAETMRSFRPRNNALTMG
jgi:hypothetical protein